MQARLKRGSLSQDVVWLRQSWSSVAARNLPSQQSMIFNHIHFVFKQAETTNHNSIYFFIVRQTCRYYVKKASIIFHPICFLGFSSPKNPPESASEARSLLGSITGSLPSIPKPWEIAESYGINLASAVAKKCHGRLL